MVQAGKLTVLEAGRLVGRSKSHVFRAIRSGTLSAERDDAGNYRIDRSELARVFPLVRQDTADDLTRHGADTAGAAMAQLEARLADALDQIADLRRQRDREADERRQVQARLDALLTDQRPRRAWWRWGRSA